MVKESRRSTASSTPPTREPDLFTRQIGRRRNLGSVRHASRQFSVWRPALRPRCSVSLRGSVRCSCAGKKREGPPFQRSDHLGRGSTVAEAMTSTFSLVRANTLFPARRMIGRGPGSRTSPAEASSLLGQSRPEVVRVGQEYYNISWFVPFQRGWFRPGERETGRSNEVARMGRRLPRAQARPRKRSPRGSLCARAGYLGLKPAG